MDRTATLGKDPSTGKRWSRNDMIEEWEQKEECNFPPSFLEGIALPDCTWGALKPKKRDFLGVQSQQICCIANILVVEIASDALESLHYATCWTC